MLVDPKRVQAVFLGGSGTDQGNAIAVDASGNAYITGWTTSTDFPLKHSGSVVECILENRSRQEILVARRRANTMRAKVAVVE